jgi:hypothetical protein
MKTLILLSGLLLQGTALAQQKPVDLDYSYVELRFVDVNSNGGDGFRFNASYDLGNNWQIVGGLTSLDFNNNVDSTAFELGAGYVWHYTNDFDFFSTLRYVNAEIDNPVLSSDDDGLAFSAGTRGLLTPEFEIRGAVNHVTVGNSDTYLDLAGDYYFSPQFAAGLSVEFAGDTDVITIGARWFFK